MPLTYHTGFPRRSFTSVNPLEFLGFEISWYPPQRLVSPLVGRATLRHSIDTRDVNDGKSTDSSYPGTLIRRKQTKGSQPNLPSECRPAQGAVSAQQARMTIALNQTRETTGMHFGIQPGRRSCKSPRGDGGKRTEAASTPPKRSRQNPLLRPDMVLAVRHTDRSSLAIRRRDNRWPLVCQHECCD